MSPRRIRKKWRFLKNKQDKIMLRLHWNNKHTPRKVHIYQNGEFHSGEKILKFLDKRKFKNTTLKKSFQTIKKSILLLKSSKSHELIIPKVFSFIKNPEETISTLKELASYGLNKQTRKIFINHEYCEELGICASTVMDTLILSIKDYHRHNKKFKFHGRTSPHRAVTEILAASGILHHLHILEGKSRDVERLELLHNQDSATMTQDIIDYLIRCLNSQGFSLKGEGKNKIGEMLSEVTDNCKQHSGLNEWFALGHYSKYQQERKGKVRLVIFNFGNTIFESFNDIESVPAMYKKLKDDAKTLKKNFNNTPSLESLITLYSLQDSVSRFKKPDNDRGSGTIKLINIFQAIGRDKNGTLPTMSITSGSTQIVFDQKYRMDRSPNSGKYIIAFNDGNDLNLPPSPKNVFDLKEFFPGTIISMEFFIDRKYIENMLLKGVNKNAS